MTYLAYKEKQVTRQNNFNKFIYKGVMKSFWHNPNSDQNFGTPFWFDDYFSAPLQSYENRQSVISKNKISTNIIGQL